MTNYAFIEAPIIKEENFNQNHTHKILFFIFIGIYKVGSE